MPNEFTAIKEFTAIIERGDDRFIASRPEIPGADGQGRAAEEARTGPAEAIALIPGDRREDAPREIPADAIQGVVVLPRRGEVGRTRSGPIRTRAPSRRSSPRRDR